MGPPWCGVTRGCFGEAVVVSVPQRSNTYNTYRYIHIHAYTCIYIHIHTHTCIVPDHNTYSNDIQTRYRQIATDTYKYLQITTPLKIPTIYLHIPTITTHTYIHDTYRYVC